MIPPDSPRDFAENFALVGSSGEEKVTDWLLLLSENLGQCRDRERLVIFGDRLV